MDTALWRARLEARTPAPFLWPELSSCGLARRVAVAELLRSYAEGELAERCIGASLVEAGVDADDRAALSRFLDDERRHGELLVEAAARLGGRVRAHKNKVDTLSRLMRPLGFLDLINVCHLIEVVGAGAYRVLRAANRDLPLVRGVLSEILRDEGVHMAFHGARLVEALRSVSPLRRLRMRAVHLFARRVLLTGNAWLAPPETYQLALGMSREAFKANLLRIYDRAYARELAYLRTGRFRS